MNELFEQFKGYIKAFEVMNDGNYEGTDYLIDVIGNEGNELITIENYLMKITGSNERPISLCFEKIENWKDTFETIFDLYFTRNIKITTNLYKSKFFEMLNKYINDEEVAVFGSGISNGYSCITEYLGEVSGSDVLFVFKERILILHFGIND